MSKYSINWVLYSKLDELIYSEDKRENLWILSRIQCSSIFDGSDALYFPIPECAY